MYIYGTARSLKRKINGLTSSHADGKIHITHFFICLFQGTGQLNPVNLKINK